MAKGTKKSKPTVSVASQDEERFKRHLELSSEWYWEQDENYRFTLITGGGFEKTGIDPRQNLGAARWDHGAVPVGDGGTWDAHRAVLEARKPFTDLKEPAGAKRRAKLPGAS